MRAALQSFLRLLCRFLFFSLTAAFDDVLLCFTFLFLFMLLLPLFGLQDRVLPALLVLGRAVLPVAGIFLTHLLPALAAFLTALFPPILLFLGITHLPVPLPGRALALGCGAVPETPRLNIAPAAAPSLHLC